MERAAKGVAASMFYCSSIWCMERNLDGTGYLVVMDCTWDSSQVERMGLQWSVYLGCHIASI